MKLEGNWHVVADRKNNILTICVHSNEVQNIQMSIQDAYLLASNIIQELDRTNPLLREPE